MYHQLHGEVVKQQETIDAVDEQIEQAKDSTGKVVAGGGRLLSSPLNFKRRSFFSHKSICR